MLKYQIDVIGELKKVGINTTRARETGIFGQATMKKFKDGDTSISLEILNRLCAVLNMQPKDILEYTETEKDRQKYISKTGRKIK